MYKKDSVYNLPFKHTHDVSSIAKINENWYVISTYHKVYLVDLLNVPRLLGFGEVEHPIKCVEY